MNRVQDFLHTKNGAERNCRLPVLTIRLNHTVIPTLRP